MPAEGLRIEQTLGSQLQRAAGSANGVRFVDGAERLGRLSYEALFEQARDVAGALRALGLAPGDRVALVYPTGPEFLRAFFGASLAGLVPAPLYPPFRLGLIEEYQQRTAVMLRACRARAVLADRRARRLLGPCVELARPQLGCLTLEELPVGTYEDHRGSANDLALIQFSSGSVSAPKPVALTHAQLQANVGAILKVILESYPEGADLTHAGVSWLPLYHDMGLVGCLLTAVARPAELTLIPPELFVARPALWLRVLSRERATVSPAPNFAYALCAERVRDDELVGVDLSSWRLALNGAEPVTPAVLERFVARFARYGLREEALTPVYGLAEAALAVTFFPPRERFVVTTFDREQLTREARAEVCAQGQALVSLGRALPGIELRIAGRDGRELASGSVGRVLVRGPSVMSGYDGLPEATRAVLCDGWLDTGDLGFLHDGSLYLVGRAKELVIVRGRNYAPQDIEHAAEAAAGVRRGCVAAIGVVREGSDGEQLVVLAERRSGEAAASERIADEISRRVTVATGLVPAEVLVLDPGTLPRTSSGKLRRSEARQRYLEQRLTPPQRATVLRVASALAHSHAALRRSRRQAPD
ncbi:MAG: fatty acyl-AMP ligase [Proteobacteria bacterium]|nr:fatty acyl-AMP ligase [Pseudomonadota bacterium]